MRENGVKKLADFDADYLCGRSYVVGIDEAGRGALAGPVAAAAAAISSKAYSSPKILDFLSCLDDSKKLSAQVRESLWLKFCELKNLGYMDFEAAYASVEEIESQNILNATRLAMSRAAQMLNARLGLGLRPAGSPATLFGEQVLDTSRAVVIIDGRPVKKFPFAHVAVVKGDSSSLAVAAASVVAKVSRDRLMVELASKYPRFGFEIHKGYGTAAHLQALMLYGPSAVHRPSFLKNIRADSLSDPQGELF